MTDGHFENSPFWETKRLEDLTVEEWEALCDGCGLCCLIRLQDDDTEEIFATKIACKMLNAKSCRCNGYGNRQLHVPTCIQLTPDNLTTLSWLPDTCAYVIRSEGRPLHWWHPLVSGSTETVHNAGISVKGRTIAEGTVEELDYEDFIIDWA